MISSEGFTIYSRRPRGLSDLGSELELDVSMWTTWFASAGPAGVRGLGFGGAIFAVSAGSGR